MIETKQILNYRIVGEGYSVIFLHGFLESNSMWKDILPHLPHIKAICIELPGHGKSKLLEKPLTLLRITQAVKNTIDLLSITHFSIVGHSLGGYVALHLAKFTDLKIAQLILLNSHPWADSEAKKANRIRVTQIVKYDKMLFLKEAIPSLYLKPELFETQINALIDEAYEMEAEAINENIIAMRDRTDQLEIFEKLGQKIHIIQGEFDQLIAAETLMETAKKMNANFHLIRQIGHMAHHEAKDEVIRIFNTLFEKKQIFI